MEPWRREGGRRGTVGRGRCSRRVRPGRDEEARHGGSGSEDAKITAPSRDRLLTGAPRSRSKRRRRISRGSGGVEPWRREGEAQRRGGAELPAGPGAVGGCGEVRNGGSGSGDAEKRMFFFFFISLTGERL